MDLSRNSLKVLLIFFLLAQTGAVVGGEHATRNIAFTTWLRLGPVSVRQPVLMDTAGSKTLTELLKFSYADIQEWWPEENLAVEWDASTRLKWERIAGDSTGVGLVAGPGFFQSPQLLYLAAYIDVRRWTKGELEIKSPHPFLVFLDGNKLGEKAGTEKLSETNPWEKLKPFSKMVKLETGKHMLLVKTLWNPENAAPWKIQGTLKIPQKFSAEDLALTLSPTERMTIHHLLDTPQISGVSISPDGKYATVNIRQAAPPEGETESWIELRDAASGKLIQTYRGGMKISSLKWSPVENVFAYLSTKEKESTLWIVNLAEGTTIPLLKDLKNFDSYTWSPDGRFLIYSITDKAPEIKDGVKRMEALRDRWPDWRDRTYLYRVNYPEGTRMRLTAGKLTTELQAISPDGKRLLFTRTVEDLKERPYGKTELYLLNLTTLKAETLWTGKWFNSGQWSPDGRQILLTGGPSMFGELGWNLPEGMIPNEFDTQAYLFSLRDGSVVPLTRNFDPDIIEGYWAKTENAIYFTAIRGEYRELYRYDISKKSFHKIESGVEVISDLSLADSKPIAVYFGSSATVPHKAYVIDLNKKRYRILSAPEREAYQHVRFGKVESWNFKNYRGETIEGRIHYPPDFDPGKKYPVIVYYYGGVNPTNRSFGGRYPKNLFAAQGYVVYVLQPSGATGYGQRFSAYHVNDWGQIVSDEIIDGISQFLDAHPFADRERVAGIGASYGGFMTMLLVSKTDLFRAAVAHAGISSISSYWGEGYWGFLYSAIATANSFPWNRKDIYVEQSPLFRADKVNTPILLLHGTADTNVPPGESMQFFTALKLLGKPVEFVQVFGQNHWILKYNQRIKWMQSILAYFDKWLKDQPDWWRDLYPEP